MIRDFLNTEEEPAAVLFVKKTPAQTDVASCDLGVVDVLPVGMTYAPSQTYADLYDPEQALCAGTLFRALDLPFRGRSKK